MCGLKISIFRVPDDVAAIADCMNQRLFIVLYFISEPTNVNFNEVEVAAEVKVPNVFGDHSFA